jgi:hypothetical protein
MVVLAVSSEPLSGFISLLTGNLTGNFANLAPIVTKKDQYIARNLMDFHPMNPV